MEETITKILAETISKEALSFLLSNAFSSIKKIMSDSKRSKLLTKKSDIEIALQEEIIRNFNWSYLDLFENHNSNKILEKRYVHLDLLLSPRRTHISREQLSNKVPLKSLLNETDSNIVILGQPGSGKTTSMKFITSSILLNSDFLGGKYFYPLIIRLRDLNEDNSLLGELQNGGVFEKIAQIFNLKFKFENDESKNSNDSFNPERERRKLISRIVPKLLEELKILLILDGFDEIGDLKIKNLVIEEVKELNRTLHKVNFILTSRTADFKLEMENTSVYELSELNDNQLEEFSKKWFDDNQLAKDFLVELFKKTPYKDFYRRPLLLTHIASIYSKSREIPDKPKLIYKTIIELILKEWNEIQGLKRKSHYSTFSVERKREFLTTLSFYLKIRYNKAIFSRNEIREVYLEIASKYSLPKDEVDEVINEIESHNGIILKSGYDSFEYSHLTIHEFFTGDYIARGGAVRLSVNELTKMPNELAVAISLSSEPSYLLYDLLVEKILKNKMKYDFLIKFLNRLELEKPDFGTDAILGVCLLSIYKRFIDWEHKTKNHSQERLDFEEFIETNKLGSSIDSVFDLYNVVNLNFKPKHSADTFIEIKKKKDLKDEIFKFNFPRTLYMKKDETKDYTQHFV